MSEGGIILTEVFLLFGFIIIVPSALLEGDYRDELRFVMEMLPTPSFTNWVWNCVSLLFSDGEIVACGNSGAFGIDRVVR